MVASVLQTYRIDYQSLHHPRTCMDHWYSPVPFLVLERHLPYMRLHIWWLVSLLPLGSNASVSWISGVSHLPNCVRRNLCQQFWSRPYRQTFQVSWSGRRSSSYATCVIFQTEDHCLLGSKCMPSHTVLVCFETVQIQPRRYSVFLPSRQNHPLTQPRTFSSTGVQLHHDALLSCSHLNHCGFLALETATSQLSKSHILTCHVVSSKNQ
mmetsp:Transcript_118602/g.232909  ORF Transcript_118602/g.232909 Transcript_118602/m.232909 type:complete len:209 (+) Transcript_118602:678-1304(+)